MMIRRGLCAWWWRGCFPRQKALCSSLRNFSTAGWYLSKTRRGSSKGSSRYLCQILKEVFFTLWMSLQLLARGAVVSGLWQKWLLLLFDSPSLSMSFLFHAGKRINTQGGRRNGQPYITGSWSKWQVQIPARGLNWSFLIHLWPGRGDGWQRGHGGSFSVLPTTRLPWMHSGSSAFLG